MEITSINTESLSRMFLAGAKNLEAKKEWINELNVFPVPDGDTGTNMSMTIMSAAREVGALSNPTMKELAKAISSGSLRGARGNSGVILSQLFRGFCKVIKEYDEVDVSVLCDAFQKAVETAYKAVMKPKEGTILTVAKGAADKALDLAQETEDLVYFCDEVIKHAEYVLSQTPEMLPVLKQAGVVDSGGQGLVQVLKGAYDSLLGKEIDYSIEETPASAGTAKVSEPAEQEIKYGYCTEFIIVLTRPLSEKEEKEYKSYLESIGDSIVVVADDEVVKTHVHTNDPGLAIQKALTHGSLTKIKIDNMREEHQEKLIKDAEKAAAQQKEQEAEKEEPRKPMGFIAVSIGEGMNEIFRGLGADYLIEGGQTMNPSTEDMLAAIDHVNADHIFILPNNKNIIMAANQAAELTEDKDIIVLPTKTIPQGIVALVNYIPDYTAEENKEAMLAELDSVKTGQVTYAVRDTEIDGMQIRQNDYMGIGDKAILAVGTDLKETTMDQLGRAKSVKVGKETTIIVDGEGSKEDIQARIAQIKAQIEETTSDFDREKLQERLAKMSGGVAVVRVGAATETEMQEAKLRMEDALAATRAAVEEGIIAGGGSAYIHASKEVAKMAASLEGDEKTGANIILKALEAPLRRIAENAGLEGSVIIDKVRSEEPGFGFNALTEEYVNMVDNGILDPAKVTRSALQNATSVASTLLTTESVVANIKEDAPAMPAGGAGGMGMM